ncbi:unnamed protein product [Notodromas monacha]|uniref:Uncharacterized protein n=1 Tax=Notodromas monacha TaxID=399045 RepID=A0A7R9BFY0_9CRUS|nr:unnamed protein product [Notodromas monacha]CAG0914728.1 unnamed protein product [Notodromas monacha]
MVKMVGEELPPDFVITVKQEVKNEPDYLVSWDTPSDGYSDDVDPAPGPEYLESSKGSRSYPKVSFDDLVAQFVGCRNFGCLLDRLDVSKNKEYASAIAVDLPTKLPNVGRRTKKERSEFAGVLDDLHQDANHINSILEDLISNPPELTEDLRKDPEETEISTSCEPLIPKVTPELEEETPSVKPKFRLLPKSVRLAKEQEWQRNAQSERNPENLEEPSTNGHPNFRGNVEVWVPEALVGNLGLVLFIPPLLLPIPLAASGPRWNTRNPVDRLVQPVRLDSLKNMGEIVEED